MRAFHSSLVFLLVGSIQVTLGSPTPDNTPSTKHLYKRYSGTPSGLIPQNNENTPANSDYPDDDAIRAAFIAPSGNFVFFSGIPDSDAAFNFAKTMNGAIIFRQAFPKRFTIKAGHSEGWYQDFADRFSGVFAEKASGDVYFVSSWNGLIDNCRVWKRIELPTLMNNPAVDSIILVDYTNFANKKVIYTPDIAPFSKENLKRDTTYCFDWGPYGEDPADPDADPSLDIGYFPGNCGIHIKQYQKNENGVGPDYRFDITLFDDQQQTIGELDFASAPGGQAVNVDSRLPLVMEVTAQNVDSDPVKFAYGGQSWDSSTGQCKFGGYDSGSRQGDCGFQC